MKQLFILLPLALLLGSNLAAESINLEAKIPFAFEIGSASLPSGVYTIQDASGVVRFHGKDGVSAGAASITFGQDRATAHPDRGRLVFNVYGNRYFLQAVQPPGTRTARYLPKSRAEIALAKSFEKREVILALAR